MGKKILFVNAVPNLSTFGGYERVLETLWDGLESLQYEVRLSVFIFPNDPHQPAELVRPYLQRKEKIFLGYLRGPGHLKFTRSHRMLGEALQDYRPDIIIISGNPFMITAARLALRANRQRIPIIYWDHGYLPFLLGKAPGTLRIKAQQIYQKLLLPYSLNLADGFFSISSGIAQLIASKRKSAGIWYTPNPVRYLPQNSFIGAGTPKHLIYVGRLDDGPKNISFLIQSLRDLADYPWELRIVGRGPDEESLKLLAKRAGLDQRIHWLGFQEEPFKVIPNAGLLLLTSRSEGFAMVLVEAHLHGIPTLSSDCLSGPTDIIIPGLNGDLYREGNRADFVAKLADILKGIRTFSSSEEIARSAHRFSPENSVQCFVKAIESVLAKFPSVEKS